jgi:hypothetical protein
MTQSKALLKLSGLSEQTHGEELLVKLGEFYSRVFYFAVTPATAQSGADSAIKGAADISSTVDGGGGGVSTVDDAAAFRSTTATAIIEQVSARFGLAFCAKCLLKRAPKMKSLLDSTAQKIQASFDSVL